MAVALEHTPATSESPATVKPLWRRALARFGFAYWLLFCSMVSPEVFDFKWLEATVGRAWTEIGLFVGHHLLGITDAIATDSTGSGDRTVDYLVLIAIVILAVITTAVWSMFDVHGRHDARVRGFVRITLRYTLGFIMVSYGLAKLSAEHGQFPPPGMNRLLKTYGDSSPMGILWTFMGTSQAYTKFAGLGEILGGVLVLFRRTTLAGALVLFGVLANVVMLNFCYDVPVKIDSAHYLLMAMVLVLPDVRRLIDAVVLHRAVAAPPPVPVLRFRGRRLPVILGKLALAGTFFVLLYLGMFARATNARSMWFDGWWAVDTFTRNGQAVPAIVDDATRWRRMKFETAPDVSYLRWHNMDGSYGDLLSVVENTEHALSFKTVEDGKPATTYAFSLTRPDVDHFTIAGKVGADDLSVTLHRLSPEQMLLVNRGFHWINEVPFNR